MKRILRTGLWLTALTLLLVVGLLLVFRLMAFWREFDEVTAIAPTSGQFVQTEQGKVFVQISGPANGQPVLLVPGTAAWGGFWGDVAVDLAKAGYRPIAIDLPPFGYSAHRPTADYSRSDQARRLRDVIAALKLEAPLVVGHSFGAGAVVELAASYSNQIKGMVIVCGAVALPDGMEPPPAATGILPMVMGNGIIMRIGVAASVTNPVAMKPLLRSMLHRKEAADDRQAAILLRPMTRGGTTAAYADWVPYLLLPDSKAQTASARGVSAIRTPTAIIWGEKDSVTPLPQGERLKGLISGATLDVIPDVGHIPHIEAPAAFLPLLKQKLAELKAR
ncbi:MAG: alpha/beta fold hydrolase [Beijerinckiaceae bacterium]